MTVIELRASYEPKRVSPFAERKRVVAVGDGTLEPIVQSALGIVRESAGPWVNSRTMNMFTGAVVAVLVMLSVILTASVLFADLDEKWITGVLAGGAVQAIVTTLLVNLYGLTGRSR